MRRCRQTAAALVALVLTGAAGCGGSGGGQGDDGLTIAVRDDLPGIGLRGPDGVYRGLDIDVATYVAGQLGVPKDRITWKATVPAERENLLVRGDVDLVVASYSITEQRKRKVSFAGPYFLAHQDLLVRAEDTSIKGAKDLNSRKLCSVTGSTSAQNVKDELAPDADLQEFSSPTECLTGLENEVVDALTNDDAILAGFAAQRAHRGKFRLVGLELSDERYGIGVAKSDSELRDKVNKALREMVSDKSWDRAVRKHFGRAGFDHEQAPKITETG